MARPNLADPSVEPSDEELIGLSTRAFAHVPENQQEIRAKLQALITKLSQESMARLRTSQR